VQKVTVPVADQSHGPTTIQPQLHQRGPSCPERVYHCCKHARGTLPGFEGVVITSQPEIGMPFTLAPTLAFVLLGKGEDTDVDVGRSSIGGRCSLSISDFHLWTTTPGDRLDPQMRKGKEKGGGVRKITHASSNDLVAFLMPSAPSASVTYDSLNKPDMLLSSVTHSDSSLYDEEAEAEEARRGQVSGTMWRTRAKCDRLRGSCS